MHSASICPVIYYALYPISEVSPTMPLKQADMVLKLIKEGWSLVRVVFSGGGGGGGVTQKYNLGKKVFRIFLSEISQKRGL